MLNETPSTPDVADKILDGIVNADKVVDPTPAESKTSPDASNTQEQPASDSNGQQVADDKKVEGEQTQKPAEAKDGENKAPEEGQKPEGDAVPQEAKIDDAVLSDLLGEPEPEPVTLEAVTKKYEESSREAHRIQEELQSKQDALAQVGVELVRVGTDPKTKKGIFALKPTEKYAQEYKPDFDAKKIYDSLSDAEKELFDVDHVKAAELLLKKAGAEIVAKRPPVTATEEDQVLGPDELERIYSSFVSEKLRDGKPRYPDANTETVREMMARILWGTENNPVKSPEILALQKYIPKHPELNKLALRFAYAEASRILYPLKVAASSAKSQAKEAEKKNKQEVSVQSGGANTGPQATSQKRSQSVHDSILDGIVGAKPY